MSKPSTHSNRFQPGIEALLQRGELKGLRIGLVSHLAAVDGQGTTTAQRLWRTPSVTLTCLMGPEHGFFGAAGAGAACRSQRHPDWRIPVYSLYGETRKPRPAWLRGLDVIITDLQDLGFRPYTYVSTLKLVLEAAATARLPVIVADRPVPLPRTVDGPMPEPGFESFVSAVPAPMAYGMTPAETALWLRDCCVPDAEVRVAAMRNYHRDPARGPDWPPWMRPSPSITTWDAAQCFPATVCLEALPSIDHGRQSAMPFQLVGAPWTRGEALAEALNACTLPGVVFHPHLYGAPGVRRRLSGIRVAVTDSIRFKPVVTGITLLHVLTRLYGHHRVWGAKNARPTFFDKLFGTDSVRTALQDGVTPAAIAAGWQTPACKIFMRKREELLLYSP